jgi:hypothetical protein
MSLNLNFLNPLSWLKQEFNNFARAELANLAASLQAHKTEYMAAAKAANVGIGQFLATKIATFASTSPYLSVFAAAFSPLLQLFISKLPDSAAQSEDRLYDEIVAWLIKEEGNINL